MLGPTAEASSMAIPDDPVWKVNKGLVRFLQAPGLRA